MYIKQVSSTYNNNSELTACGISSTYKRNSRGPKIEPGVMPQDNLPREEYSLPTFTMKDLWVKYELNQATVELRKTKTVHFVQENAMVNSVQKLSVDQLIPFLLVNLIDICKVSY